MNNNGSRYLTDLEWRICHAVNMYIYRNGAENSTPVLVHVPPAQKRNMKTVLAVVHERVKFPVGYAKSLYRMDGSKIRHPSELQMYNNYVVGSNYDKSFKCVPYGRCRSPLLVLNLNRFSKHVRVLRMMNAQYDQWLGRKRAGGEERPDVVYPGQTQYTQNYQTGHGGNLQQSGGPLCTPSPNNDDRNIAGTSRNQPAQNYYPAGGITADYAVNTCLIDPTQYQNGPYRNQLFEPPGDDELASADVFKVEEPDSDDMSFLGPNPPLYDGGPAAASSEAMLRTVYANGEVIQTLHPNADA